MTKKGDRQKRSDRGGWFRAGAGLWPMLVEKLQADGEAWPEEAILMDLQWWDDQERQGKATIPGRPTLAARWGITDWQARKILRREGEWRAYAEDEPEPSGSPRSTSDPPAIHQRASNGDTVKPDVSREIHQRSTSAPPTALHTRVGSQTTDIQTEREGSKTRVSADPPTAPADSPSPPPGPGASSKQPPNLAAPTQPTSRPHPSHRAEPDFPSGLDDVPDLHALLAKHGLFQEGLTVLRPWEGERLLTAIDALGLSAVDETLGWTMTNDHESARWARDNGGRTYILRNLDELARKAGATRRPKPEQRAWIDEAGSRDPPPPPRPKRRPDSPHPATSPRRKP